MRFGILGPWTSAARSPSCAGAWPRTRTIEAGRAALAVGDHARGPLLREALTLWRGPALPDLPEAHTEAARLKELRLAAVQLYGQLMRALHAAGRPAGALTVYEDARRTLADELGADPSPEPSAPHLELLQGDEPERPRPPSSSPVSSAARALRPRR